MVLLGQIQQVGRSRKQCRIRGGGGHIGDQEKNLGNVSAALACASDKWMNDAVEGESAMFVLIALKGSLKRPLASTQTRWKRRKNPPPCLRSRKTGVDRA